MFMLVYRTLHSLITDPTTELPMEQNPTESDQELKG
jgi:hypothetical protein